MKKKNPMKTEQAIRLLEGIQCDANKQMATMTYNALSLAIAALEKQTPKKPESINDEYAFFVCGNCKTAIYCSDTPKAHHYCLHCGQQISWEQE